MIVALLALQAATAAVALPLPDALAPQSLPERGCAAYLWSVADRRMVAMVAADPARLRLALGGKPSDYTRVAQVGNGEFGLGGTGEYRLGDVNIRVEMTVVTRPDLTDGGSVPQGMLTIVRPGADEVIVPVAGMIGCAPAR